MTENIDMRRLCGMLGLAARAGKLKSGEVPCEESLKSGRARICVIASDASEGTRKHFTDMCRTRKIEIYTLPMEKGEFGRVIGRGERSSGTVEDDGFARNIVRLINGGNACEQ